MIRKNIKPNLKNCLKPQENFEKIKVKFKNLFQKFETLERNLENFKNSEKIKK